MKVIVVSDNAGISLKNAVVEHLSKVGIEVFDAGVSTGDVPLNYRDCTEIVARAISTGEYNRGILISATGVGMSIAANRHQRLRAVLCNDTYTARQSRIHNDSNILCLGESVTTVQRAIEIVCEWLTTEFQQGDQDQYLPNVENANRLPLNIDPFPTNNQFTAALRCGIALCPSQSAFAPLLYAGDLIAGFSAAAEAGFPAVEMSLKSELDIDLVEVAHLLEVNHLIVSALATGRMYIEDSLCLADTDPKIQKKVIERLKQIITLAKRFNSAVIIGGIRGRLVGTRKEQSRQRETAIESLQDCIQFADQFKIQVLIEPINRYETNFINTSIEGISFLDDIGRSSPKLLLDTYHMNIEEADLCATIRNCADRLGYVHVADSNRLAPGQGHIDFKGIFSTLLDIGYAGFVSAEILPVPDNHTAMRLAGEYLNKQNRALVSEFIG